MNLGGHSQKGEAVEITGKQPQRHLGRKTSIARKIKRRHSTKVGGRFNEVEQLARTGGRQRGMNQSGWKVAAVTVVEEIVGVAERGRQASVLIYVILNRREKSRSYFEA